MSKIIIGIHGLGNKPPKEILEKWWKQAIVDGLEFCNYNFDNFTFELVYWADILHPRPLSLEETEKTNPLYLTEPYATDNFINVNENLSFRKKALEYLEKYSDKILLNGIMSLKLPALTELFIHRHLRDLEIYYSSSAINHNGKKHPVKELIINRLVEVLKKHRDKQIFLVAHSMGSIITHDALIDYAPDIEIDTLVTIGSPLAQKYHIKKLQSELNTNSKNKLTVPENICRYWYNLSDLEDQIAVNHKLSDFYKSKHNNININDMVVENKYISNGIRNPHKSYGYLRTPEFALIVYKFMIYNQPRIFKWLMKKLNKLVVKH